MSRRSCQAQIGQKKTALRGGPRRTRPIHSMLWGGRVRRSLLPQLRPSLTLSLSLFPAHADISRCPWQARIYTQNAAPPGGRRPTTAFSSSPARRLESVHSSDLFTLHFCALSLSAFTLVRHEQRNHPGRAWRLEGENRSHPWRPRRPTAPQLEGPRSTASLSLLSRHFFTPPSCSRPAEPLFSPHPVHNSTHQQCPSPPTSWPSRACPRRRDAGTSAMSARRSGRSWT